MDEKIDMVANMATLFKGEFSRGQVSWATSKPRTRTWPPENINLNKIFLP